MKKRSMRTRAKATQTFDQTLEGVAYHNWVRGQLDETPKANGTLDENEVDEELEQREEENDYNDDDLIETSIQLGLSPEGEAILLGEDKPVEKPEIKPTWSPLTLRHTKK